MSDLKKVNLCHLLKRDNFDGYGFDMHAHKGRTGHYIGRVESGSPADEAGLRQNDRVLEVNDEDITNKTHKQVVELIKSIPGETKLLVASSDNEENSTNDTIPDLTKNTNDGYVGGKTIENGSLNLNMTAAELRAKLAAKKKFDPKKETMDLKKKFDIVQKL